MERLDQGHLYPLLGHLTWDRHVLACRCLNLLPPAPQAGTIAKSYRESLHIFLFCSICKYCLRLLILHTVSIFYIRSATDENEVWQGKVRCPDRKGPESAAPQGRIKYKKYAVYVVQRDNICKRTILTCSEFKGLVSLFMCSKIMITLRAKWAIFFFCFSSPKSYCPQETVQCSFDLQYFPAWTGCAVVFARHLFKPTTSYWIETRTLYCKKNSPWPGIFEFFPARKSLASDIPAGDGKMANLFYSVKFNFLQLHDKELCLSDPDRHRRWDRQLEEQRGETVHTAWDHLATEFKR